MPRATSEPRAYDMRGRAASAANTRERILVSAYQRFVDHGYEGVTLPRVAAGAGVSIQTVVLHVGTKDGLIKALIEHRRPREEAAREVPIGDVDAAAAAISARYEEIGPAMMRLLPLEDQIEAARAVIKVGRASHWAWVERTFGPRIRERGKARARRLATLVAAFDVYTWHLLRRVLDAEQAVIAMAELARGALGSRASDKNGGA